LRHLAHIHREDGGREHERGKHDSELQDSPFRK